MLPLATLVALTVTALLVLSVGSASALTTRQLQTQITGTCPAPGDCPAGERITFARPEGLTVDSSGRLWVTDGRHIVDRFSSAGAYEARNDGTGSWGDGEIGHLAFSAASGEVFVADRTHCALWGLEAPSAAVSGKELRPFGATEPCNEMGVAADNSAGVTGGDLYVAVPGKLLRIKSSDGSVDDFTAGPGIGTNEIAGMAHESGALAVAPDGDFYWGGAIGIQEFRIDHFSSTGELIGEITEAAGQSIQFPRALAVDPTTENLLALATGGRIAEFEPNDSYLRQITKPGGIEFLGIGGLAVDSTGHLFVSEASSQSSQIDVFGPLVTLPDPSTGPTTVQSTTEATLHGEVNPLEIPLTECFFEYGESTAYGQTAECEPEAGSLGEGNSFVPVEAQLANLEPGTVYHYRLVAANANGQNDESADRSFFTGATIDATSASAVTATTATLETEINPRGLPTTYRFQYGTTTAYGSETPQPPAPLGAGTSDVARAASLSGLAPATVYHFRVLATNSLGTVEGPDRTFTTQPASSAFGLPDDRGYELVSPPDKHGTPLLQIGGSIGDGGALIQAAADGSALTYAAGGAIVSEPSGNRSSANSQDLSTRGDSGWSTADLTTPHQFPLGVIVGNDSEYKLFSQDLSLAALYRPYAQPLSPLASASEPTDYLRAPDGSYTPLVYPGNVPQGTHFGGPETQPGLFAESPKFVTGTADMSHLLVVSPSSLVAGFDTEGGRGIYEWSQGTLTPVSYVPAGAETLCGGSAPACVVVGQSFVGIEGVQVRNAISADGSRAFFTSAPAIKGPLDLRDLAREETLLLDAPQGGTGEAGAASFQTASADGSRVFFTDPERLTEDSTAAPGRPDLYMCEVPLAEEPLACDLRDLTANHLDPAEPAALQGDVIGAAEDGSSLYFVADGALTNQPGPEGEAAVPGDCVFTSGVGSGRCNLYRYDLATESLNLLAVLSGADFHDWDAGSGNLGGLTARVSPDGRWLAFMSQRPLTGYDNRDAASGEPDEEVFLYDAAADRLHCASCNPSGARPHGRQTSPERPFPLVDGPDLWESRWYAANVPGWTAVDIGHALYQSRYLSNSGRLFFNASDALAPSDSNGTEDVYSYEPPGVGSCTESDPRFAARNGGCVSLISSGTSPEESAFLDASESGNDVFFLTASRLTAKDEDNALDIYDARVEGGEPPLVKPVECNGDACQQPAGPPNHPTPGTLLVNGPENVKECPKAKVKKSGKCVKQRKAKKHHKKGHKRHAKSNRGASK